MNSFIAWIGGKKNLREKIIAEFPEKKVTRYVEVFGGAGWVLFARDSHAKIEVLNDINGDLINLYRCIKYHPNAVAEELEYCFASREQFFEHKNALSTSGLTEIQRAARFYAMVRISYGADARTFGVSPKNLRTGQFADISRRLKNVVIENLDYKHILKTYDRTDTLFYLDPPYYAAEKYYPDRFNPEDHVNLKACLDNIKGYFVLSYNDCDYIRDLYKDYHIIAIDRPDNLNKKSKEKYKEVIIKNF